MNRITQFLIVILLAFIAVQLIDLREQGAEPSPGTFQVRCPGEYRDGYYFPSLQKWCDDPSDS